MVGKKRNKELAFNHYFERTTPRGKEIGKMHGNREHSVGSSCQKADDSWSQNIGMN